MKSHALIQKSLVLFIALVAFSSCNQQEFYEKEYLEGAGVPDEEIIPDAAPELDDEISSDDNSNDDADGGIVTTPGDNTGSNGGDGDNTGSNGGDGDNTGSNGGDGDNTGSNGGDGDNTGSNGGDGDNTGSNGGDGDNTGSNGVCGEGVLSNASDEFVQNTAEDAKVDILWVMDNSGSMSDEQQALAYNFNAFISSFIEKDIDFQMAVTTTDASYRKSGRMIGDSSKLTSAAAKNDVQQFMDDFSSMIRVGTDGSGQERGLQTSTDFFDRYRDWARQDAYLIVVYISDEEDQSYDFVSNYVSGLQSLKASTGMVKAYSIVTQELDPKKQWETIGNRYMEASRATGGEIADIHQDFHTTLESFGFRILDLLDSFPLSGVPVGTEISVTVNGVDLSEGWNYDENARSIKFDENAIPDEGEVIIAYYQECVMAN